ncbi:porin PorA family protein [Corynebacterium phocae]|uniref:porin PorA family protein n=1 Tax=Corynebacterium phocae TaxID=161895 RepID=UPI000952CED7|nr:porin PorA family protein [Corynebacterium phocae]
MQRSKRSLTLKDPLPWLLILAVVAVAASFAIPSIFIKRDLPLPLDVTLNTVAVAPDSLVLMSRDERPHRTEVTLDCKMSTSVSDSAEKDSVATVDTLVKVFADEALIMEMTDSLHVNRESTYPVEGSANLQIITVENFGVGATKENTYRQGLTAFFPSNTEQRSYLYYDSIRQADYPLDYTGKEKIDGVEVYVYQHTLPAVYIPFSSVKTPPPGIDPEDVAPEPLVMEAKYLYTEPELSALGLDPEEIVTVLPYYSVDRLVKVEPRTGTVVDLHENYHLFLDTDEKRARATVDLGIRPVYRAIFDGDLRWDRPSREAAMALATPVLRREEVLSTLALVLKLIGVLLLIAAAVLFAARRQQA